MHVVRVREFGPTSVLRPEETDEPSPGPGQFVVDVEVAGVVYGDVIIRSGRYPFPLPYVPGLEVAGRVTALGDGVDTSWLGRRVVATTPGNSGGYAQRAAVDVTAAFDVPQHLPVQDAVAVFQAGAVAYGLLDAMRVRSGETVLVTAAAGRVGSLLVQAARAAGAVVVAAAGGEAKVRAAGQLGAAAVVDYTDPDWVHHVREATGGDGVDVALDAIGGELGAAAVETLRDAGGRLGVYGFTSDTWTPLDALTIGRRGLTVTGPLGITFKKPAAAQRADAERALRAAAEGGLRPWIHASYPLPEAFRAHDVLESRTNVGAVVLIPTN